VHHPEPLITIRKTASPMQAPLPERHRVGRWAWHCNASSCLTSAFGFGSQPAALSDACRHLVARFGVHHGEESSYPLGNRHHIQCRCGWECTNERTEQAAEYALDDHIHDLSKALTRATAGKAAA